MADANYSNEIWKDIPEWEGLYQASDYGRIRSVPRTKLHKSKTGKWFEMPLKGMILAQFSSQKGYRSVTLCDLRTNRKPRPRKVHRLVALAFIPNPECKPEVAHNDGCRTNNVLLNLRWATRLENMADISIHKKQASRLG